MADLTVIDDSLVVRMEGAVRILSQERELRIPLAHIVGVVRDPDPFFRVEGVRASPGIHRDEDDDESSAPASSSTRVELTPRRSPSMHPLAVRQRPSFPSSGR